MKIAAFMVAILFGVANASNWYVATNGLYSNSGSIGSPWNISTAMSSTNSLVVAGDTVWISGGTYGNGTNVYECRLANSGGSLLNPITFRRYGGERAIIDGGISCFAPYIVFRDFEITCSVTSRTNTPTGRPEGLDLEGTANKAINLVIHDTGHPGIGFWSTVGDGGEIYGCIIWGVGLYDTSLDWAGAPRGSGIYMQNDAGNRYVTDVTTFKNFTTGMKAYGESGNANGFQFVGNVSFGNTFDAGLFSDAVFTAQSNIVFSQNYSYQNGTITIGDRGASPQNVLINSNYFVSDDIETLAWSRWISLVMTNNTLITTKPLRYNSAVNWTITTISTNSASETIDYNSYVRAGWASGPLNLEAFSADATRMTFGDWQNTKLRDANGSFSTNFPSLNIVEIRTNKYEKYRARIIIYNWNTNATQSVDLSPCGMLSGCEYSIVDVQNYFGPAVISGTFNPSSPTVILPLNLTNSSVLVGAVTHMTPDPNLHTDSRFNIYELTGSDPNPFIRVVP